MNKTQRNQRRRLPVDRPPPLRHPGAIPSKVGVSLAVVALMTSACGDEFEGDAFEVRQSEAQLKALCHGNAWQIANDVAGVIPGLGTVARSFVGLSKLGQRYACESDPLVTLQIEDVKKVARDQLNKENLSELEKRVTDVGTSLMNEGNYDYDGLKVILSKIQLAETSAGRFNWGALHVRANLATMKYGVLVGIVNKSTGGVKRQAAIAELRTGLKSSIDGLESTEKAYFVYAGTAQFSYDAWGRCQGRDPRYHRGYAKLGDLKVEAQNTWSNTRGNCHREAHRANLDGQALIPEVKRQHRARIFTAEYQALRALLDAALARLSFDTTLSECRIRHYDSGRFLRKDPNGAALSLVTTTNDDSSVDEFYHTRFRIIDVNSSNDPNAVMIESTYSTDTILASKGTANISWLTTQSSKTYWSLTTASTPTGERAYFITSRSHPGTGLVVEQGNVRLGPWLLGGGTRWVFEGACARFLNTTNQLPNEERDLMKLAGYPSSSGRSRVVTRLWSKAHPNLKLAVDTQSGSPRLVLKDLSQKPGTDLFRFVSVWSGAAYRTMRLERVGHPQENLILPGVGQHGWTLKRLRSNIFLLWDEGANTYLRVTSGGGLQGSPIADDAAEWILADVESSTGPHAIEIAQHGKCLDVGGGVPTNGNQLHQWGCILNDSRTGSHPNQLFELLEQGDDIYQIVHRPSGKCVDVAGGGRTNGTKIQLWDCMRTDHPNQVFKLHYLPSRHQKPTFQLRNAASNKCIDVSGGARANGTKIQLWNCSETNENQMFSFRFPTDDFCKAYDGRTIALRSYHGRYVSARGAPEGYGVKQTGSSITSDERFRVTCARWTGEVTLGTVHGRYVSARQDGNVIQMGAAMSWESFYPVKTHGGAWGFLTAHGRWMSALPNSSGLDVRQADELSTWEAFDVVMQ